MTPRVSIIIASYNHAAYIGEAIESALAQRFEDCEVVVVDDGSSDDSVEVIGAYAVRLIRQDNAGVARARNRGARAACGDFLVFLDSDDRLDPGFVEACHGALVGAPAEVAYAYTGYRRFGVRDVLEEVPAFSAERLIEAPFIPVTSLIRRAAFDSVGGFSPDWTAWEDYELWLRLLDHGLVGVRATPAPLLEYRQHHASRNALSRRRMRALRGRLMLRYPGLYARTAMRRPLHAAGLLAYAAAEHLTRSTPRP